MIIYTKIKPFPTVCACPSCHMKMDDKCYLIAVLFPHTKSAIVFTLYVLVKHALFFKLSVCRNA